jgi:misacylated tRNA(Ala) deacylase
MTLHPTLRLYLDDPDLLSNQAQIIAVRDGAIALDRSCFYPGGGGQPPDEGSLKLGEGAELALASGFADDAGVVWHVTSTPVPDGLIGVRVALQVHRGRRDALARYHTVLHVLNAIALRDYDGWITGAQIAPDYARIDFKLEAVSPQMRSDLEHKVNVVLASGRPVRASYLSQEEFSRRHDLLRTLEVRPPVHDGRVRVVEIEDFDAQACGGTHVSNTSQIGRLRIERSENKGKINKRLYVRLENPGS